jgi:hypothetical protein
MGIDCGFDLYPPLEPTPSNKEKYKLFINEVLATYGTGDYEKRRDSVVRVVPKSNQGAYIEFMVGEHPTIPYDCEHFLRFSSKVSGSLTQAESYIKGVYKIAKKWLGDCVRFWHEMNEVGDHRQWGYYDWNEVYAARRRMELGRAGGETNHENEGMDRAVDT